MLADASSLPATAAALFRANNFRREVIDHRENAD
jgi:hypothetical protein